jgi:hypothetical protein
MPIPNADKLFAELEQMGEQQARVRLAQGVFARYKVPLIELWLSEKDKKRSDEKALPKTREGITMAKALLDNNTWKDIEKDFDVSKQTLGKKIRFVTDPFKRRIIFRDIEQAYILSGSGFSKPALILAGGVIEELLRIYLESKHLTPPANTFDSYIRTCEANRLLKLAIHRLTDSVRQFRNLIHLEKESSSRFTISKATAKGAVSSIFTIANDF